MRKVKDILLDADGDLLFKNGDVVIGESTLQHQRLLLLSEPGNIGIAPMRGVGIESWLLDDADTINLGHKIEEEYTADGLVIKKMDFTNPANPVIKAQYE